MSRATSFLDADAPDEPGPRRLRTMTSRFLAWLRNAPKSWHCADHRTEEECRRSVCDDWWFE